MKKYELIDVIYQTSTHQRAKRVISSKTKFLDSYIYKCQNLTQWLRYKQWEFRYNEVLFFLDIPYEKMDIKDFALKVEEKYNGDFLDLLKKIEVYFNQEDRTKYFERLNEMCKWKSGIKE